MSLKEETDVKSLSGVTRKLDNAHLKQKIVIFYCFVLCEPDERAFTSQYLLKINIFTLIVN